MQGITTSTSAIDFEDSRYKKKQLIMILKDTFLDKRSKQKYEPFDAYVTRLGL
jgi:hypothetical protein